MKTSASKIALAERRQKAIAYRRAGASYRSIALRVAAELGLSKYTEAQAFADVSFVLREIAEQSQLEAAQLRELESQRLDQAVLSIASRVQQGDLGAIDRWIRLSERRSRLFGLDAPIALLVQQELESELQGIFDLIENTLPPQEYRKVLEAIALRHDRANVADRN